MPTLQNELVRVTLDDRGRLTELVRLSDGHDYAGSRGVWRVYCQFGEKTQHEIRCDDQVADVTVDGDTLTQRCNTIRSEAGNFAIAVSFTMRLVADELRASIEVTNNEEGLLVKEVQFPLVGGCPLPPDHELISAAYGGLRYKEPKRHVRDSYRARHHPYTNEDHRGIQVQGLYPGVSAGVNCFVFPGQSCGLYFGSHDPTFRNTVHLLRLDRAELEAGFSKHLFLDQGASVRIEGYVVAPYRGTWHAAADKYASWARSWYAPARRPAWIDELTGWHRLIMKHQNGDVLFPYSELPRIHESGARAGFDTLFMFGWWPGGMDRWYPEYVADPELGGEAELRKRIREFQEELGGNVILYASGRLVDRQSQFYRDKGRRLSIKRRSGDELSDAYLFGNRATYERMYGAVELVPMCIACEEWVDELRRIVDIAADLGCKGVFFDQLSLTEYPCCDRSHGHPVPYFTQPADKRRILAALRDYAHSLDPRLAIGNEIFSDVICESFDFIHGLYHQNYIPSDDRWVQEGRKPEFPGFFEFSRYMFPEMVISDRDIRDGHDVPRRVNLALLLGLVNDVEIYRCRRTIDEVPEYQEHLGKVNALRSRMPDLLVRGTYRDRIGFTIDTDQLEARCFTRGDEMVVLATQSWRDEIEGTVEASGLTFNRADGVEPYSVDARGESVRVRVGRHGIAALVYRRL